MIEDKNDELNQPFIWVRGDDSFDPEKIPGIIELFKEWAEEAFKKIPPPVELPIANEVFEVCFEKVLFQDIKKQMENGDREVIQGAGGYLKHLQKQMENIQQRKTRFLTLKPKDRLEEIEQEYTLKIIDYVWNELLNVKEFFEEQQEKAFEPPDFKEINKRVDAIQSIKIDKEIAKYQGDLFPHSKGIKRVENTPLEDGKRYEVYEKDRGYRKIQYFFMLPKEAKGPTFSKNTGRIYYAINLYAFTEKTLNPYVRKGDLVKRLGGDKHLYDTIDDHIDFLVKATYEITDKKKHTREIGHLIDYMKQFNTDTQGSYYYLELNPHCHTYLKATTEGEKDYRKFPYVKIPIQTLLVYPKREKGIVNLILQHRGQRTIYPFTIERLLEKEIGLSKKEMGRSPSYLAEKLDNGLNNAKAQGFKWRLTDESFDSLKERTRGIYFSQEQLQNDGLKKGIIDKLKTLKSLFGEADLPASKTKGFSKGDFLKLKIILEIPADDPGAIENLTERIIEWNCKPEFKTKKPKEEVEKQVYNTIKKYGVVEVERCLKNTTHPREFWNAIKRLKMDKA